MNRLLRFATAAIAVMAMAAPLTSALSGQAARADSTAAALADIEQHQLTRAMLAGDRAAYGAFLADDWSVINTDGNILTKEQILRDLFATGERKVETIAVDEVKVRRLGEAAVVTGRTIATGSLRDKHIAVTLRFTDVFARRGGRWQIVASQGTLVP